MTLIFRMMIVLIAFASAMPCFAEKKDDAARIQREEIRAAVMSFSDTWASVVYEAALQLKKNVGTPAAKSHADRFRFYNATAGFDIAASPYPGVSLLDMMVLTSLTRIVWEEHWLPDVYHEAARPVLTRLQRLESEIWNYAKSVLTAGQLIEIREVIREWRAQHQDQVNVVFVRFSSFGKLGRKPSLEKARETGGLLGPVRDAVEAAEEIRALGERALFLTVRMQELVSGRFELSVKEILGTAEIQQLLTNISGFEENADRYAAIMETLPDEIADATGKILTGMLREISIERQAALNQLLTGVAEERSSTIVQLLDGIKLERYALTQNVERLVKHSKYEIELMTIHVFVLLGTLVLLIFLMWLIIRFVSMQPSTSWLSMLGAGITMITIAVLIIMAALTYVKRTRPELPILPVSVYKDSAVQDNQKSVEPQKATPVTNREMAKDFDVVSIQVLFDPKDSTINPRFYPALDSVIKLLKNNPLLRVDVAGHTDSQGENSKNRILSEQRAFTVAQYLEQKGIDVSRIKISAFGSNQPVAVNNTVTGRVQNRRVEIIVIQSGS